jgi:magnesium chelatase subunit ChlI-like protein
MGDPRVDYGHFVLVAVMGQMNLSARGYHRVARTIADLAGHIWPRHYRIGRGCFEAVSPAARDLCFAPTFSSQRSARAAETHAPRGYQQMR